MQVYPAIDLRQGLCVRLQQGDYDRQTVFSDDPVAMALKWVEQGAEYLHLVDLDAARDGTAVNRPVAGRIAASAGVPCQLGGGVRSQADVDELLGLGLARLVVGTQALKDPAWFAGLCRRYPGRLILGLDARDGCVATDGWRQTSQVRAVDLVRRFADEPLAAVVYTDIARDGMLAGPNVQGAAELQRGLRLSVIASGGVASLDDVRRLAEAGLQGCIIGRALYEGRFALSDALAAARASAFVPQRPAAPSEASNR